MSMFQCKNFLVAHTQDFYLIKGFNQTIFISKEQIKGTQQEVWSFEQSVKYKIVMV